MKVLLISTYELGRQPFGLASPAAWLRAEGHAVTCIDLACERLPTSAVEAADLIAFYLPMHTATRLALRALRRARRLNPAARLCAFGLYAPLNEVLLRELGIDTVLGGEFEAGLLALANGDSSGPLVSLARQQFRIPDRSDLPPLDSYARLVANGDRRKVGYTEASRGCKHLCRHCPIVPVYNGVFRIVQPDVVLEDIGQQVAAGAQHITFGDPDFFNGPGHAQAIVEALHARFPAVTYDVTVKVEHLLKHRDLLSVLRRTGCLFVTSAVESADDAVLEKLAKGHTRADFIEVVKVMRDAGLTLVPTFVTFTPWTTRDSYRDLLRLIVDLDLVENVAPIQLAIRLLIPAGSRLLELEGVRRMVEPFDHKLLVYPWHHTDPWLDRLCADLQQLIKRDRGSRAEIFGKIWRRVFSDALPDLPQLVSRAAIPYLTEPWYC